MQEKEVKSMYSFPSTSRTIQSSADSTNIEGGETEGGEMREYLFCRRPLVFGPGGVTTTRGYGDIGITCSCGGYRRGIIKDFPLKSGNRLEAWSELCARPNRSEEPSKGSAYGTSNKGILHTAFIGLNRKRVYMS